MTMQDKETTVEIIAAASLDELVLLVTDCLNRHGETYSALVSSKDTPHDLHNRIRELAPLATNAEDVGVGSLASAIGLGLLRTHHYASIDISSRGARLNHVELLRQATTEFPLIVNDLSRSDAIRPEIAIGLWSSLASPTLRLGARGSDPRDGLLAEIALAAPEATYLVIDRIGRKPVAMFGRDMVAVEIVVLAFRQIGRKIGAAIGPWEDPLIQHATDFQLGIVIPEDISLRAQISAHLDALDVDTIRWATKRIAQRVGVENVVVESGT